MIRAIPLAVVIFFGFVVFFHDVYRARQASAPSEPQS